MYCGRIVGECMFWPSCGCCYDVYVRMYVCMYVCMYICTYVCMYVCVCMMCL